MQKKKTTNHETFKVSEAKCCVRNAGSILDQLSNIFKKLPRRD